MRRLPYGKFLVLLLTAVNFVWTADGASAQSPQAQPPQAQPLATKPANDILRRLEATESANAILEKENAALRERVKLIEERLAVHHRAQPIHGPKYSATGSEGISGTSVPTSSGVHLQTKSHHRASLPKPVETPAHANSTAVQTWNGFYIGGNVGYAWGNNQSVSLVPNDAPFLLADAVVGPMAYRASGVLEGFQVGYNWLINQSWLVGLETDFDFANIKDTGTNESIFGLQPVIRSNFERLDWLGTARARFGYLQANNLLMYGTGGFAYGKVEQNGNLFNASPFAIRDLDGTCAPSAICFNGASERVTYGWTVGGGLEYSIWNNWQVRAEYLYVVLRRTTFTESVLLPDVTATAAYSSVPHDLGLQILRTGINYKF